MLAYVIRMMLLGPSTIYFPSGAHPFDHDESSLDPNADWMYSHPDLSQVSVASDNIVKARIMKGNMDFTTKLWNDLPDGQTSPLIILLIKRLGANIIISSHSSRLDAISSDL